MDEHQREICENCHAPLSGDFCSQCGQSARELDVPIGTFARDMVSESFDLDSRLRKTMGPLFFRPGLVPKEYVAGHRARFVPPIRLYLLASFAMFLLMSLGSGLRIGEGDTPEFEIDLGGRPRAAVEVTPAEPASEVPVDSARAERRRLEERLEARLSEGFQRIAQDRQGFAEDFANRMAQAMFLLLPLFALLLKGFYPRRLYVHHLVFAIYLHSWFFLVVAMTLLPEALGLSVVSAILSVALLWAPVYLFLGMRRFYGESRLRTFVKFLMLSNVYLLLASVTMLAVLLFSIALA